MNFSNRTRYRRLTAVGVNRRRLAPFLADAGLTDFFIIDEETGRIRSPFEGTQPVSSEDGSANLFGRVG